MTSSVLKFISHVFLFSFIIFQRPKERGVFKFYLPKIFLMGAWWVISIAFLTYFTVMLELDPSFSVAQAPGLFTWVGYTWLGLLVVYAFQIFFYFVRLVANIRIIWKRGMPPKFLSISFLTGIVIVVGAIAVIFMFALNLFFNSKKRNRPRIQKNKQTKKQKTTTIKKKTHSSNKKDAVYVLGRSLVNYYVYWFAFLMIPTRKRDLSYTDEESAGMLKNDGNQVPPVAEQTIDDY